MYDSSYVAPLRAVLHFLKKPKTSRFASEQRLTSSSKRSVSQKTSSNATMAYPLMRGGPSWTPPEYASLADVGYTKNVVVFRCINLIARSLSSLQWLLTEQREDGEYELEQHPLLTLLKMPNAHQSGSAFLEEFFSQLLLSGNAYIRATGTDPRAEKVENDEFTMKDSVAPALLFPEGVPQKLDVLRSDRVSILIDSEGNPCGFEYCSPGGLKTYPCDADAGQSVILHLRTFHPLNDWYGLSPVAVASRAIDQHNAVGEHNLAILQNGGRPSGALLVKPSGGGRLTDEQREELRRALKKLYEGASNAGRIFVLEGNCEWREMGLSPRDLDFQAGKNMSAREIALAFGVPPILIGLTEDATFSNYKESRLHFWEETLLPLFDHFVSELNRWLVPYFGENLRLGYDRDAIEALSLKRETMWDKIQSARFLTINEKRQAVGYDPIEGGDRFE